MSRTRRTLPGQLFGKIFDAENYWLGPKQLSLSDTLEGDGQRWSMQYTRRAVY